MPGLNLGLMGGARATAGNGFSNPAPATASQAAFGMGTTNSGMPTTGRALAPNDPFGVALWTAVLAAGILIWIRHGLPG